MLSGIKTGKRKRPKKAAKGSTTQAPPPAERVKTDIGGDNNKSAADELRQSLLGGSSSTIATSNNNLNDVQSKLNSRASAYKNNELSINNLQSRGRISDATISTKQQADVDSIIIQQSGKSSKSNIQYEHETKLRYNSRGKLSNHAHTTLRAKTEKEMSIDEMIKQERSNNSNMDEVFARNMIKMGKGYNKLDKIMGKVDESGVDEEDMLQETSLLVNMYKSNDDKLSPAELAAKSKSKQIAQHDAISKWTAKSWWWMESSNFNKQYLIALGEKISLVMTPTHKTLQQHDNNVKLGKKWNGGQCWIVPLAYSESFVSLDEDSWYEVKRFQSSLRQMFAKDGRGVIFIETVTRTSKGGGGGGGMALQAKMEVIPVPKSVERDAPLYFKSGLAEVAQEWGTHNKCIVLDGKNKTLRSAVPRSGFPYFYCGWPSDGNNEGYCQLIENEDDGDDYCDDNNNGGYGGGMRSGGGSKRFPRDFGIDTIGGIMGCDPMRFQRKRPAQDGDRGEILKFLEYWKPFDWTLELDG